MTQEQKEFNSLRLMYSKKVKNMVGDPPETFEDFYTMSKAISVANGTSIQEAAKRRLNSISYTPYVERAHSALTSALKTEGMMSRLYRWGGKSSFAATNFNKTKEYRKIKGVGYHSTGTYNMGGVLVTFWYSDDGSEVTFIGFRKDGREEYLQARKGDSLV